MLKKTIYLFGGQGTQYSMMGKNLYTNYVHFREVFDKCDSFIREITGFSLVKQLYQENHNMLNETLLVSNLTIFCIQYSLAHFLLDYGIEPDYVCGTSLGEFVSAAFAYPNQTEAILNLLIKFSIALHNEENQSGMVSVVERFHSDTPSVLDYFNVELAARNFAGNYVIAGKNKNINQIISYYKAKKTGFFRLPVPIGFHSSAIDFGKNAFYDENICFNVERKSRIAIISSLLHSETKIIDKNYLWNCIRRTIEFQATVEYMEEKGEYDYVDLSPSGMLSVFIKHILKSYSGSSFIQLLGKKDSCKGLERFLQKKGIQS